LATVVIRPGNVAAKPQTGSWVFVAVMANVLVNWAKGFAAGLGLVVGRRGAGGLGCGVDSIAGVTASYDGR
jgi:hypothetical protein